MKADALLRAPSHGSRRLAAWLEREKVAQAALARALGVSGACVSDWLARKRLPGELYRAAIDRYTSGAVPATSWQDARERALAEKLAELRPHHAKAVLEPQG